MAIETKDKKQHMEITNTGKDKYKIKITIPADVFQKSYNAFIADQRKKLDIQGFRKGNVPTNVVEEKLGKQAIFDVFNKLAPYYVGDAIRKNNLVPIVPPSIDAIPKIILGTDIFFTITIITAPDLKKIDLQKIKIQKEESQVNDDDIEKTLIIMWQREQASIKAQEELQERKKDQKEKTDISKKKSNNKKTEKQKKVKPKLTDQWAKKIAKKYNIKDITSLDDLRKMIKKTGQQQKDKLVEQNYKTAVLKKAIELAEIELPKEAIEYEAKQREYSFRQQLKKAKQNADKYVKDNNTSWEKLHKLWEKDSKEALEEHLFLTSFAKSHKIKAEGDNFDKFIEAAKKSEHFKEIPDWSNAMASIYVKSQAFEKLLNLIENKK